MIFTIELEREDDVRWLAEVLEFPEVLVYGQISDEAIPKAQRLALRVIADRLKRDEDSIKYVNVSFALAEAKR
jgi:hypothetical protein